MLKSSYFSKYFILPVLLSILMIAVSLYPLPALPENRFIPTDKLGHLLAFLFLAMTYLRAFRLSDPNKFRIYWAIFYSFMICTIIGGMIELLQHYLPIRRYGDWFDFYFDIAGISLGIILYTMFKNKRLLSLITFLILSQFCFGQSIENARIFQEELNLEFGDSLESPLDSADLVHFKGLEFFPIDEKYIVEARLVKQNSPEFFTMETTTSRRPEYRVWAYAYFTLEGKEQKLTIYQSKKLMNTLEYGDYLFLPFSDLTNGESTYYGGRYVDLRIPEGDSIIIDFNKSYNPYCAYSDRYSCPKVPSENALDLSINAGVKKFH